MRRVFCNSTSNMRRFMDALGALDRRGAEEACLVVVDGEPGLGKTTSLQWWAVQSNSVFLRAKLEWSPGWMMKQLVEELDRQPHHSFKDNFSVVVEELNRRMVRSQQTGEVFAIVVDEADHISRSMRLLETLRDLSDTIEVPVVLIGMGRIRENLRRFPQVASRVSRYVTFDKATVEDVRAIADTCCEAPIADDMVGYLRAATGGYVREIKEGLKAIEMSGLRQAGRPVTVADMAGKHLFNDRRGDAHIVRAV